MSMLCELMGVSGIGKSTLLDMYNKEIPQLNTKLNFSRYSQIDSRFLCDFSVHSQFLDSVISLIANSSRMFPTQKSTSIRMLIDTAIYYYGNGYHKERKRTFADYLDIQEELFMHRAFSFLPFCDDFENNTEWYFSNAPVPDRVLILRADKESIVKRIQERKKSVNTYLYFEDKDLSSFIENVESMYAIAEKVLSERGVIVSNINVDCSVGESFESFKAAVKGN